MRQTNSIEESLSDRHPDAERVGPHLVIDKTEWVPGKHPEPHRQHENQTEYLERYLRCIQCGVEVLNKRDFPKTCEGEP
jgi:succinate dehydrogenase/fumarate reductase-like Fe-S protein